MKKTLLLICFVIASYCSASAQTALPLSGPDCNGVNHDLIADLDAGKAVILHFFMPSCGSCPPPAQKIQMMANNILADYPGMITAYAMPYNNTTTCATTANWVTTNSLPLYMPYDSGATQVAHYGGFGMPTVVLLGGTDHRTLFVTQSFATSDTTIMRDSILALLDTSTSIAEVKNMVFNEIFPNPATQNLNINFTAMESGLLNIKLLSMNGKVVEDICTEEIHAGVIDKKLSLSKHDSGLYFLQCTLNGKSFTQKVTLF